MPPETPEIAPDAERLRQLVQAFVRRFGLLLEGQTPCGQPVSTSYAHALMFLLEAGGARQSELGGALGIDKSNVTRLCAQMEQKGHIEQARVPEDGRARLVSLTARGRRLAESVQRSSKQRFVELLERIPPRRRRTVLAGLAALDAALVAGPERLAS
jgi:DNA-binding MarR family transcriptional regulator